MGLRRLFYKREIPGPSFELSGVTIPNPIGLKYGGDPYGYQFYRFKNCMYGFLSVGPLLPTPGDLKILIENLSSHKHDAAINAILSHGTASRGEDSITEDYNFGLSMLYDFADMFTVDTTATYADSSKPLQDLSLLQEVLNDMLQLRLCYEEYKPIIVKVRPQIPENILDELLHYMRMYGVDAICVGEGPESVATVKSIFVKTQGRLPIIGCVPVLKKEECRAMKNAGADLIAGGTSFFHRGPAATKRIIKYLKKSK